MRKVSNRPKFKRVVIKLSGEVLGGAGGQGIDHDVMRFLARQIRDAHRLNVQIALVIGGGNIFRGLEAHAYGLDRTTGDCMGMLATVINGLALQNALEKEGVPTRVQTAIEVQQLAEPYIRRRAVRHLEKGRVVIFVGGTGSPYFSTDTAAALKASEIGADALLKATKVDGVYSADPAKDRHARLYRRLSYMDVLKKRLRVMDSTAISLCMDNDMPVIVFNLNASGGIKQVLKGYPVGTLIGGELPRRKGGTRP